MKRELQRTMDFKELKQNRFLMPALLPISKKGENTCTSRTVEYYFNYLYSNSALQALSSDRGDPQTVSPLWDAGSQGVSQIFLVAAKDGGRYPPFTSMRCQVFWYQDEGHGRSQEEKLSSDTLPHSPHFPVTRGTHVRGSWLRLKVQSGHRAPPS